MRSFRTRSRKSLLPLPPSVWASCSSVLKCFAFQACASFFDTDGHCVDTDKQDAKYSSSKDSAVFQLNDLLSGLARQAAPPDITIVHTGLAPQLTVGAMKPAPTILRPACW